MWAAHLKYIVAQKRAPKLFIKLNIEWVYRLLIDWKRIGRMRSIPKFMFKVLKYNENEKEKISIYSDTNYFKYGEGGFKSRGLNPPLNFILIIAI